MLKKIPEEVEKTSIKEKDNSESKDLDSDLASLAKIFLEDEMDKANPYIPYVPYEDRVPDSLVPSEKNKIFFYEAAERRARKTIAGELEKKQVEASKRFEAHKTQSKRQLWMDKTRFSKGLGDSLGSGT